ncbi:MAG: PadR family transcriptional regulator [Micrococcales bacterium]|nr:MAG: PadR family transcriptional regulator [Micrococcales bacterium]PIE26240.1 MAG: PadR family transcriptional regulator [Micrococcales bacterium]
MPRRAQTLQLAILGLLEESSMHGYELRKQLNAVLGWGRVLSYGSLYPALKQLVGAGLLTEETTTGAGRQRVVYTLTESGERRFAQLMAEVGPAAYEDESFGVRMAFFGRTDAEIRLRILEGRRVRLQERLERIQTQLQANQRRMDRYAAELQRHGAESVEQEMTWLNRLINAERNGVEFGPVAAPQQYPRPLNQE